MIDHYFLSLLPHWVACVVIYWVWLIILLCIGSVSATQQYDHRWNKYDQRVRRTNFYTKLTPASMALKSSLRSIRSSAPVTHTAAIASSSQQHNFYNINVSGITFCVSMRALRRYPFTKLARHFLSSAPTANSGSQQTPFADRNPVIFACILDFYRSGQLHVPHSYCYVAIEEELEYWQIDSSYLAECCATRKFFYCAFKNFKFF